MSFYIDWRLSNWANTEKNQNKGPGRQLPEQAMPCWRIHRNGANTLKDRFFHFVGRCKVVERHRECWQGGKSLKCRLLHLCCRGRCEGQGAKTMVGNWSNIHTSHVLAGGVLLLVKRYVSVCVFLPQGASIVSGKQRWCVGGLSSSDGRIWRSDSWIWRDLHGCDLSCSILAFFFLLQNELSGDFYLFYAFSSWQVKENSTCSASY